MLVLRDIMLRNRRHFRELLAGSEEGIAPNSIRVLPIMVALGCASPEPVSEKRH